MKSDYNKGASASWLTAIQNCAGYDSGDNTAKGDWRLPTQRELMLIWIHHEALKKITDFQVYSIVWSATENGTTEGWGCKVDLVRLRKGLRSLLLKRIEQDGIYA